MKIQIETSSYNSRRYGKPWIAKVDFSTNKKGDFNFGDWIGQDGSSGVLEIDVQPGDVIARGQKDMRKPANSAPDFYIVGADCKSVTEIHSQAMYESGFNPVSKAEAYKHFEACKRAKTASPTGFELLQEKDALLARIADIDAQLKAMLPDDED